MPEGRGIGSSSSRPTFVDSAPSVKTKKGQDKYFKVIIEDLIKILSLISSE